MVVTAIARELLAFLWELANVMGSPVKEGFKHNRHLINSIYRNLKSVPRAIRGKGVLEIIVRCSNHNSGSIALDPREITHDEQMSCGNQPANTSLINRRD